MDVFSSVILLNTTFFHRCRIFCFAQSSLPHQFYDCSQLHADYSLL